MPRQKLERNQRGSKIIGFKIGTPLYNDMRLRMKNLGFETYTEYILNLIETDIKKIKIPGKRGPGRPKNRDNIVQESLIDTH